MELRKPKQNNIIQFTFNIYLFYLSDKNSSSFKRPTKDMNIAAGCPMFIRKEKLQQYIVDDVLFIETLITTP